MSAPESGPSTSRVKSKLSSKQPNYVLGGLSISSAATTTTHHNVSDVVGAVHPCSSCSAEAFSNCFDYHDSCYFDFYSQYREICTDKLTGFNLPTSLQEAFDSNTNDVAAVSDLDNAPSDVSISDTSKTKEANMDCSNVPEKMIIPPSSMDYLQLIPKLNIDTSKKKKIPSSSKKKIMICPNWMFCILWKRKAIKIISVVK